MKKALLIAIMLVALVGLWLRAGKVAVATSAAQPWPGGMGTLDSALDRFPPLHPNDASRRLTVLANALPKNETVDDFVAREIARGEITISDPPALSDLSEIRELLLREPIVWERQEGIGNTETETMRVVHLTVARTLVASALTKAGAKDPEAWADLHAAWKLVAGLEGHPQVMAQTAALTTARMINAVAWRMPLPAPVWFGELQERDNVRPLLDRYRAEREATANALRLREGKAIETASRCSDSNWNFDGTTLRLSREIATAAPDKPMPLALRLKP